MNDELTDLLPLDRQKTLRHRYFIRLCAVGLLLLTALVGAAAVLLFPTYIVLSQNEEDKKMTLNSAATAISSAEEKNLSTRLISLTNSAKKLAALGTASSVSTRLRTLLTASRPGITLSGLAYMPPTTVAKNVSKSVPASITVSGTAATRDALRNYQLALQAVPFVAAAGLPVSAYAQSNDIAFTITLTLKL